MKTAALLFLLLLGPGCRGENTSFTYTGAYKRPVLSYSEFLVQVKKDKEKLSSTAEAKKYFFQLVHTDLPSYWLGTPWDFNGVTREPGKGQIACGYFVTNTLTDIGFPIERVKLAQAASSVMIKAITTHIEYPKNMEKLKTYILGEEDKSVFIVGLDYHTGYMTRDGDKIYFIHSNYINKKGVVKELADKSEALKSSNTYMIGNISANDEMLKKWMGK